MVLPQPKWQRIRRRLLRALAVVELIFIVGARPTISATGTLTNGPPASRQFEENSDEQDI